jgi:hypothetical protein
MMLRSSFWRFGFDCCFEEKDFIRCLDCLKRKIVILRLYLGGKGSDIEKVGDREYEVKESNITNLLYLFQQRKAREPMTVPIH